MDEEIYSQSKLKVRKLESDEEGNDFQCYDKSDGNPGHVDIDEEITEMDPTLALLPNRSEVEEMNNNIETMVGMVS